jgi:membrane associated rhomboid family serine protease
MIIPIGTDNPLRRQPLANYALIIANVAFFLATYHPHLVGYNQEEVLRPSAMPFMLVPALPQLHQFITYAFLHGGWMHIIGNMLFLYIFGNNVNDRLGHVGYLLLYLGGAVFSAVGHALTANAPVLGASGAVAAVTGAYMVLFPKTYVHILYVIFFVGTMEIPALYFILFKLVIWDNVIEPKLGGPANVAHTAHLAGYAFGVGIPLAMLALKLLPHSPYDLWAFVKRWRRKQQYNQMVDQGFDPFGTGPMSRKKVDVKVFDPSEQEAQTDEIAKLRAEIAGAVNASDLTTAARTYLDLLRMDPQQVLPQQQQLDVANKLMHDNYHAAAATAYEIFLQHYPRYPFVEQVRLMLGLLYSRYLNKKDLARGHLEAAIGRLTDPGQRQMCQDELNHL